ncbi:MAG: hypothetical protein B7Z20_06410 [Sphingobium sp. 32-64-5]|nr:MAG: hypothetical protein B7Z20_06410 [Sphingobium sp. 32-64-5]
MMPVLVRPVMMAMLLMMPLAGCGASDEDQDVGGVTAGEARALNEAAEMLDRQADNVQSALDVRPDGPAR